MRKVRLIIRQGKIAKLNNPANPENAGGEILTEKKEITANGKNIR